MPAACSDEAAAVEMIERLRWEGAPFCPRSGCASTDVYAMKGRDGSRNARFLWRCLGCKRQFTWRVGTVMEDSHIPARAWVYAYWRAVTSKKGVAALEIQRQCGISYKSAHFLMHRVRKAMTTDWTPRPKMEGDVEADEVYLGGRKRGGKFVGGKLVGPNVEGRRKWAVMGLLQRGVQMRFVPISRVTAANVGRVLRDNADPSRSKLHTDAAGFYGGIGREFAAHGVVNHDAGEYAKPDGTTTNRIESCFGLLRRGLHGIYHSVSRTHLERYLAEFEWRYNHRQLEDGDRVREAVKASVGKRLFYRPSRASGATG
jgi:hypothetical protein